MKQNAPQFTEMHGKIATVYAPRMVVDLRDNTKMVSVNVPIYKAEERSLCLCCNKRKITTVNGVCLNCQSKDNKAWCSLKLFLRTC